MCEGYMFVAVTKSLQKHDLGNLMRKRTSFVL